MSAPKAGEVERQSAQGQRARKARDAAIILPLTGAVLLLPPVAWIFAQESAVFGIPLPVAYVFAVWAGLILAARALGRRLPPEQMRD